MSNYLVTVIFCCDHSPIPLPATLPWRDRTNRDNNRQRRELWWQNRDCNHQKYRKHKGLFVFQHVVIFKGFRDMGESCHFVEFEKVLFVNTFSNVKIKQAFCIFMFWDTWWMSFQICTMYLWHRCLVVLYPAPCPCLVLPCHCVVPDLFSCLSLSLFLPLPCTCPCTCTCTCLCLCPCRSLVAVFIFVLLLVLLFGLLLLPVLFLVAVLFLVLVAVLEFVLLQVLVLIFVYVFLGFL